MSEPNRGAYQRSSRCGDSACVEVSIGDRVLVRNSTTPGKVVVFTKDEWRAFIDGVRVGEFEV